MFLGYKNNKIIVVANTATELEKMDKYCQFDKIEETGVEYVLHNGEYKTKVEAEAELATAETEAYIAELKQQLAYSDYVVIKIAEGAATAEEYADVLAARKRWRAEINALENPAIEPAKDIDNEVVELYSMEI